MFKSAVRGILLICKALKKVEEAVLKKRGEEEASLLFLANEERLFLWRCWVICRAPRWSQLD